MKRTVPLLITGIVGVVFVLASFVPPLEIFKNKFADWFSIVTACAIVLGSLNLVLISAQKVARFKDDWFYAGVIIVCFLLMLISGLWAGRSFGDGNTGTMFDWLYRYLYNSLSSTMYAILAFYVASASYRAFRARNVEATMLLVAAFLVMLGRVPIGDVLTRFMPEGARMSDLQQWIMDYPQTAGQRAIMIGIALGIVSTSLRVMLGIERSHLGGGD